MTVKLTPERALKLKTARLENLEATTTLIRDVARLLGLMTSSFPGVMYGALHYRALEMEKTCALKQNKGNFDRLMTLSSEAKSDIQWWIDSISEAYNPVNHGDPDINMTTDASLSGWGACLDGMTTGGRWNPDEATHDINYLEMLAVLFALQSFFGKVSAKHIKLMVDNNTAVATINQMGTCHSNLNNKLVQQIWEWCILHGICLTVAHIQGKSNTEADRESRLSRKETEWCLDRSIYSAVIQKLDEDQDTLSTSTASGNTSTSQEARTSCLPLVGDLLSDQGISKEASELLFKSWRTGTQKQYRTYLERWKLFCTSRKVNPLCGTITNGIDFLVTQYKRGLTYSSLNTARCALSTVILLPNGNTFGNHPLVTRLMKGVFESRPTLPRYNSIWNLSTVLDFIKTLGPNEELSLKNVTLKCVTLVALLSGQRCQTIHALRISGMKETNGQIRFDISTLMKTSKAGERQEPLTFKPYKYDSQLCVVKCLQQYIKQTAEVRNGADQLWLSYHNPASKDTVSRWIKEFLKQSGIDISSYGAHSTRAASSSAARSSPNISLQTIMNADGWARESAFRKFYDNQLAQRVKTLESNFYCILMKAIN
nr:uncharacterized protein LOC131783926 [Pocillopora verrucosa]